MECLCKIHDGSEHEIGDGYWLVKAVAADVEHKHVIPLYLETYSQEARDFKSENDQLFKVIGTVAQYIGKKGIYAIDRGGDRGKLSEKFLEKYKEKRFVIRLTGKRDLIHKGTKKNCAELAKGPNENDRLLQIYRVYQFVQASLKVVSSYFHRER